MEEKSLSTQSTKSLTTKSKKELAVKDKNTALAKTKSRATETETTKVKSTTKNAKSSISATTRGSKTVVKKTNISTKKTTDRNNTKKIIDSQSRTASKTKKSTTSTKKTTLHKPRTNTNILAHATEYFDLPYRYNETIVKLLAQTPKRLFVYWDISDNDRKICIEYFGEDFFYQTVPFLKITNETKNYTFEVEVNDFANSWYININDDNCKYSIELYRRFKDNNLTTEIQSSIQNFNKKLSKASSYAYENNDCIFIASSNQMDVPAGKPFTPTYPRTITYRNIQTDELSYKEIKQEHDFYTKFFNNNSDELLSNPSSR